MRTAARAVAVLAAVTMSCVARGGPLDPPPGAVATTGPTMIFAVPFTINAPGAYRLVRNLTATPANSTAITIAASGVDLDLGGFVIDGGNVLASHAVAVSGTQQRISIRNGFVRNTIGTGVLIATAAHCRIEGVTFDFTGSGSTANLFALDAGPDCSVRNCTFNSRVAQARLGERSLILDCTATGGGTGGGFEVGARSVVSRCAVTANIGDIASESGIHAGAGALVTDCCVEVGGIGAASTGNVGISVGDNSTVSRCSVGRDAGGIISSGISAATNCSIRDCTISGASNSILSRGIAVGVGCRVSACTVAITGTSTIGIQAGDSSSVLGCEVSAAVTGVSVAGAATVMDNTIANAATGIALSGANTKVFRNAIRGAATPISGAAGNDVGPAGTAAGATSPWANLVN